MAAHFDYPLTVLTPCKAITKANWPGAMPVEIRHASDISEYVAFTRGLIGASEFAQMKPTGHLINVGRAWLVDEAALFNALKAQQIRGAALDVWYNEPQGIADAPMPAHLPFWELDNVLMSPHLAALTTGMLERRLACAARSIDRLVRGEPLQNVIHIG